MPSVKDPHMAPGRGRSPMPVAVSLPDFNAATQAVSGDRQPQRAQ